jgi:hypothetical protein
MSSGIAHFALKCNKTNYALCYDLVQIVPLFITTWTELYFCVYSCVYVYVHAGARTGIYMQMYVHKYVQNIQYIHTYVHWCLHTYVDMHAWCMHIALILHTWYNVTSVVRHCCHALSSGVAHSALKCNKTNYACLTTYRVFIRLYVHSYSGSYMHMCTYTYIQALYKLPKMYSTRKEWEIMPSRGALQWM